MSTARGGDGLAPLLDPGARLVIAHRGASGHAPENTLPAFAMGLEAGADALEFDTHLTADGVAVVIHDPTLDRTTDRAGAVAALPYEAIRQADAGFRFTPDGGRSYPYRGRGIAVPTLEEVVTTFTGVPLVLEIKTAAVQREALRVLDRCGARERAIVSSFDPAAVTEFRRAGWTTGASSTEVARLKFHPLPPAHPPYRALFVPDRHRGLFVPTRRFVRRAAARGATVHVWTVNDPALAVRLWANGCVGIISNVPATMVEARRATVRG